MIELLCLALIGKLTYDHHHRMQALRTEVRNYGKKTA